MTKFKNTKKVVSAPEVKAPEFTHEQLRDALFNAEDIFDRAMATFYVLGETARHIVKNEEDLTGDSEVHLGVRKNQLTKETLVVLHDWIPDLEESEYQLNYVFQGVPVIIDIIHGDYEVLKNPNPLFYKVSQYFVPNPWTLYWNQHEYIK